MAHLRRQRHAYLEQSVAPSTWKVYHAAWSSFLTFASQCGFRPFPLAPSTLEWYVVGSAARLRYSTLKVYVAALKFINTFLGWNSSQVSSDRLYYIMRGIRRTQSLTLPPRPRRTPIALAHLRQLFAHVDLTRTYIDARCFRAAFTLAFFGLLRVSEFTCPAAGVFDPTNHLCITDIVLSRDPVLLHVRIKASKTDPFRTGCSIRVARTDNIFCPVTAMFSYLRVRLPRQGPLFILENGSFLTRADVRAVLALVFPSSSSGNINTHSFRIGGASMLASLGVPDATIQLLGRWSSNAFRRYIHVSDQFLASAHIAASRHGAHFSRIWQADHLASKPADSP